MSRPICVGCRVEYQCKKNDQLVRDKAIGEFSSTYWRGDLWECPRCGHDVVIGRGEKLACWLQPMDELHEAIEFDHG